MTEAVLGSYYKFTYIGESLMKPESCQEEGMYVGKWNSFSIFAVVAPSPYQSTVLQPITLIYTQEPFLPITIPSNKICMNSETKYCLTAYLHSSSVQHPHVNGRTSPIQHCLPEDLYPFA